MKMGVNKMAIYTKVYWFNEAGLNVGTDEIKVSDGFSRKMLVNAAKNFRFDKLYKNREIEKTIKSFIKEHKFHKYLTAVVIDDILINNIFVPPKEKI